MASTLFDGVTNRLMKEEHILFAYLFGSFSQDKQRLDSDIDLAVYYDIVSSEMDQLDLTADLMEITGCKVDLVVLNLAPPLLKFNVIKQGRILFDRSDDCHTHFCVQTLFEMEDVRRLLRRSNKMMMDQIRQEVLHG